MKLHFHCFLRKAAMVVFLSAFALVSGIQRSAASHLAGGNITYSYDAGTNTYHIVAAMYRDCQGISTPNALTLTIFNSCTNASTTVNATQVAGTPTLINPPCPGELTRCNGGLNPGIQKWEYEATITLATACADWRISYDENARNNAITTLQNPGSQDMYIETHINNSNVPGNNSVQFSIEPILFLCIGQQFCFTPGASDPDGDSLAYSFVCPKNNPGSCISYSSGSYSVTQPISSSPAVTIDNKTGLVCLTPTAIQVGVMAIQIDEYRKVSGVPVLVGTTMRDIQIYTQVCNNALPTLSGFDNSNNFTVTTCSGTQRCYDIFSNDTDIPQYVSLQFVNPNNYPVTFDTTTGSKHPTATVCITPSANDIGKTFTFTIIAKDNNCPTNGTQSKTYSIAVGNDLQNSLSVTGTNIKCNGENTGTATATITPNNGGYKYLWSPSNSTLQTASNLNAGTYCVTVTDVAGCSANKCIVLTQPASALNVSALKTGDINCKGGTTTVDVSATGGTAPYTGTGSFTRGAGTYTFIVTDANGCSATSASVTITEPAADLLPSAIKTSDVNCKGGTTTVNVSATGGTGPYSGTGSFVRSAGNYSFTVTDAKGCTSTASVSISEPLEDLSASAIKTSDVNCKGGTTTVNVSASGGTAPYSGTGSFTRGAGTYSFTVTDAKGCSTTASVTISEPAADLIASTVKTSDINCKGGTTTVNVSASGGTSPYTGTGSFTRGAGTYSFTVTDAKGCTSTAAVTISEPAADLTASAVKTSDVNCKGGTTTVNVSATGGTSPYSGTGSFTRGAGTYSFTVTDAKGCTSTAAVTISEPAADLTASAVKTSDVNCKGGTTTVNVSASGGTSPYTGTGSFTRSAGTYSFTVTDAKGCTSTASVTVSEPAASLAASAVKTSDVKCKGGTTTVNVSASGGTSPYSGTGSFTRNAGTYSFTVTDAKGCSTTASVTISEPAANLAATALAPNPIYCVGGTTTVNVSATGGTPPYSGTGSFIRGVGTHTFPVADANGCATSASITLANPVNGLLTVNAGSDEVSYYGYPPLQKVTHTALATGGTAPYTYSWTLNRPLKCNVGNSTGDETFVAGTCTNAVCPASGSLLVSPSCKGSATVSVELMDYATACVTVTDKNGCTATDCFVINAQDARCDKKNGKDHKVTVCHHTSSFTNPWVEICVDYHAIPAHLSHDDGLYNDYLGHCSGARISMSREELVSDNLLAFPNPAHDNMTIKFNSNVAGNYTLKLVDMTGRSIFEQFNTATEGENFIDIDISKFAKGVYSLSVITGDSQKQIRVAVQ